MFISDSCPVFYMEHSVRGWGCATRHHLGSLLKECSMQALVESHTTRLAMYQKRIKHF